MTPTMIYDAVPADDGDIEAPYKGDAVQANVVEGGCRRRGVKALALTAVVLGVLCMAHRFHCPYSHQSGPASFSSSSSLLRSGHHHGMDHVSYSSQRLIDLPFLCPSWLIGTA
eukprot:scaffold7850_cov171-Amphora_coffeaeformis.AAC.6